MEMALEYRECYSEVLEVLRHMEKKYVEKIPKKVIMYLYDNCSLDYEFHIDRPLDEVSLRQYSVDLLDAIKKCFWSGRSKRDEYFIQLSEQIRETEEKNKEADSVDKSMNEKLEKENQFTKIDVDYDNLPVSPIPAIGTIQKIFYKIKLSIQKFIDKYK